MSSSVETIMYFLLQSWTSADEQTHVRTLNKVQFYQHKTTGADNKKHNDMTPQLLQYSDPPGPSSKTHKTRTTNFFQETEVTRVKKTVEQFCTLIIYTAHQARRSSQNAKLTRVAGQKQGTFALAPLTLAAVEDSVGAVSVIAVPQPLALVSVGQVVSYESMFVVEHELCRHLTQFQGAPVVDDVVRLAPVLLGGEHRQEPTEPSWRNGCTVMNSGTC